MKGLELFKEIQSFRKQGIDLALVTVVETQGSTPREEGANMAILRKGKMLGTIGGGCVEARIQTEALKILTKERTTRTITAHLTDEMGTYDGNICGGTMIMLVEYLPFIDAERFS
ncbi:MAG: XdhC family protein [Candidatus Aminicenantes bacterium]|jgi:xanthine dehydrogenase accessory factor